MNVLGLFAKHWTPGSVKTRLAESIGVIAAATFARRSLAVLLDRFASDADCRKLVFTPADRADEFAALCRETASQREVPPWTLEAQAEGDLGQRMLRFFSQSFAEGGQRVVLIGGDSPTVPREFIERAFELLGQNDVVLGPATDGGYYLIGGTRGMPDLFSGIAWSTAKVFAQTKERLTASDARWTELPLWYDVDEVGDLIRLAGELSSRTTLSAAEAKLREIVREAIDL